MSPSSVLTESSPTVKMRRSAFWACRHSTRAPVRNTTRTRARRERNADQVVGVGHGHVRASREVAAQRESDSRAGGGLLVDVEQQRGREGIGAPLGFAYWVCACASCASRREW